MKITKFVHSCLLVETPDRVALFDPGSMSECALDVSKIDRLDDIFITHIHGDHISQNLIDQLVAKFPEVTITAPDEVVQLLTAKGIKASSRPPVGAELFESPHETVYPMFPQPEEIGVHYLGVLSHPGDSHSFKETKAILALPITAPWGSTVKAMNLVLELKPQYVLPIHDWHWNDQARASTYDRFEEMLKERGIKFFKMETGVPVEIDV